MTTVGGDVRYNGAGRMLTDLHPFLQSVSPPFGVWARSKDHVTADTGGIFSEVLRLRKL